MNLELPSPVAQAPVSAGAVDTAMDTVASVIDQCTQISQTLEAQFKQYLSECQTACTVPGIDCEGCIAGKLWAQADSANSISQQCQNKIQGRIISLMASALGNAAQAIGYAAPTAEQAVLNIQTNVYPTVGPLAVNPLPPPSQPSPAATTLPANPLPGQFGPPVILPPPLPNPPAPLPPPTLGGLPPQSSGPIGGTGGPIVNVGSGGECAPGQAQLANGVCSNMYIPPVASLPANPPPAQCPVTPPIVIPACPLPDQPAPQPGFGAMPAPLAPPPNTWNQIGCPPQAFQTAKGFSGNWFNYLQTVTGFSYATDANGTPTFGAPDGFFSTDAVHSLTLAERIKWYVAYGISVIAPAIGATIIPQTDSCNIGLSASDYVVILITEFVEKWIGVNLTNMKQPSVYNINYNCPSYLPEQGAADDLYRKQIIGDDLWRCWTRANNDLDIPAAMVRDAGRPRLGLDEGWKMQWLDPVNWGNAFVDAERFAGYDQKYASALYRLQQQIPGIADVFNWVAAGTDDLDAVNRYGLETGFNAVWNNEFSSYLQANGYTQTNIERTWRSHWQHVNPDMAQRMVWRSRSDSPTWPAGTAPVLQSDVDYLKNLLGIAPFWWDKLQALSRPIPNKRELQQLLQYKAITSQEYVGYLMDAGYTQEVAEKYLLKSVSIIAKSEFAADNALSVKQVQSMYIQGQITPSEAGQWLARLSVDETTAQNMMTQMEFRRQVRLRTVTRKAIKLNYTTGALSQDTAVNQLIATGMQGDEALDTIGGWKQGMNVKGKTIGAAQLCKWVGQGIINGGEYYTRLIRLGYAVADAKAIVTACGLDWTKKNQSKYAKKTQNVKIVDTTDLPTPAGEQSKVETTTTEVSQPPVIEA